MVSADEQIPQAPDPNEPRPTPDCHWSHDPACGPFRWDPPPQSDVPHGVHLGYWPLDENPRVGEEVAWTLIFDQSSRTADGRLTFQVDGGARGGVVADRRAMERL